MTKIITKKTNKKKRPKYKFAKPKLKGKGSGMADRFIGAKARGKTYKHISRKAQKGENFDPHAHGTNAQSKFRNDLYVKVYELARSKMGIRQIADALGISQGTMKNWMVQNPDFREAYERGRRSDSKEGAKAEYLNYVYNRLPDDLKVYWKKLKKYERMKDGTKKVELMFSKAGGDSIRKWLFVYAYTMNHFNILPACRICNVGHYQLAKWRKEDPSFIELLDHVYFMRKDFAEGKLMERIAEGDQGCIQFFLKTQARERGYDPKVQIEHTGAIEHKVKLDDLLDALPLEDKLRILNTMDKKGREMVESPRIVESLPAHGDNTN